MQSIFGIYTDSRLWMVLFGALIFGCLNVPAQDTWILRNPPPRDSNSTLYGITWGNGMFVAVGKSGSIVYSPDGISWGKAVSGTTCSLRSITWGDSLFVAGGDSGTILYSNNGATWTKAASGTTENITGIAWGNGQFIAARSDSLMISTDAMAWNTYYGKGVFSLVWGDNQFVGINRGEILGSPDGIS